MGDRSQCGDNQQRSLRRQERAAVGVASARTEDLFLCNERENTGQLPVQLSLVFQRYFLILALRVKTK